MIIEYPSDILMRWIILLAEYDCVVQYKKGMLNKQEDDLSRLL